LKFELYQNLTHTRSERLLTSLVSRARDRRDERES
jgi:hypothetical protein